MPLTFPNPVFPSDVAVEALDGTTHQRTGLVFVPKGAGPTSSPTLEVQVNRNLDRLHALVTESNALRAVDEGALLIGVYPGFYALGGASKEFDPSSTVLGPFRMPGCCGTRTYGRNRRPGG